ncbi:MAG: substrate-binding domain-containing protein [Christensenella sp.]|nr:substrate-binding domain-containing protein [Christensenella sp.]
MKKVLVVVLCVAMAVAMFAGCSSTPAASEAPSESAATAAPSESASEAPVQSDETGADAETGTGVMKIVPKGDIVIGISTGSSGTSWRDIMIENMKTVGDEYKDAGRIKDYKIVNNTTNGDANEQATILRQFVDDPEVNVIMVNPNDNTALNEVIADAQKAGKLVVVYDATADAPGALNVTLDHYAWETKNAEFICKTLQKGNAIEISGLDGHPANNERIRATADVLKNYPDIKLLQSTPGGWDQTKAKEATAQILSSGQEVDAVFTQDGMAYGVLQAFQDAGKLPKVMFGDPGTAFFKAWNQLREEGADFKACAQPNPPGIGASAMRLAVNMAEGKDLDTSKLSGDNGNVLYYVVNSFYTDENFDDAWAQLKDQSDDYLLTEYYTEAEAEAMFK